MTTQERSEVAASVLDAWGQAIRGDWGSIDGRSCRDELYAISSYLRGDGDSLQPKDVGVCMIDDGPHWFGNGYGHECGEL